MREFQRRMRSFAGLGLAILISNFGVGKAWADKIEQHVDYIWNEFGRRDEGGDHA